MIGIIAAVIFLIAMVIGCFFYGRLIGSLGEEFEDGDFLQDWDSIGGDRFGDDNDYGSADEDDEYDDEEYVPSPDDEYYYGPCNAINEDVSYKIVPKTYDKSEADSDVIIQVNYYLLEGDSIPNVDKLNEAIEKVSLYYAEDFLSSTGVAEYGESYYAWVDSYVTYAGPLHDNVEASLYKVKSTMCNCGVTTIPDLQREAKLTLVSSVSIVEGGYHDVTLRSATPAK